MIQKKKIGVFIISSSKLMTETLTSIIGNENHFSFEGMSYDLSSAISIMKKKMINVLILDVNSDVHDLEIFLKKLTEEFPIPVVFIIPQNFNHKVKKKEIPYEIIVRPNDIEKNSGFLKELLVKVKIISTEKVDKTKAVNFNLKDVNQNKPKLIVAIGASTGGVEALSHILTQLPENSPGIVIVQHMPPKFSKLFADRLNGYSKIMIKEAADGDEVKQGIALVAPGDKHMKIIKNGDKYIVKSFSGDKVSGHCPSVDVLFESVAQVAGANAIGIILTGMGLDGAKGLLSMRQKGAFTIGQDKNSCVIYGMPMEAYNMGAVVKQLALDNIAKELITLAK